MRKNNAEVTICNVLFPLLNCVSSVVVCLTSDFHITEFNTAAADFYGVTRETALGADYRDFCKSLGHNCLVPSDLKGILDGEVYKTSCTYSAGNSMTWLMSRLADPATDVLNGFILIGERKSDQLASRLEDDDLLFLANQVREITGQEPSKYKTIEDYVKSIRAYYEKIIGCMPNNVYWLNRNCITLGCNENIAKIMGLSSPKEFVGIDYDRMSVLSGWGKDVTDSFKNDDLHVMEAGIPVFNKEEPVMFDRDNSPLYYISSRVPLRDEQNNVIGIVGISTNITDRKRMEDDLRIAKEQAERASETKTQFMQNMQHDLRTPASGVAQMLQIWLEQEKDAQRKDELTMVAKASQRLLDLLNDILAFSKIEGGAAVLAHKFDLHDVIDSVIAMDTPMAHGKNIELQAQIADNVPRYVISDKQRIMRILLNLVGNAIKFTKEGYVKIEVHIAKQVSPRDMLLQLKVIDTGIGIPRDKIHRIYERFERSTPSNEGLYAGSGLGLSITKRFVTELNGEIDVESEEGRGSTFTCLLPCSLSLMDISNYEGVFPADDAITAKTTTEVAASAAPTLIQKDLDFSKLRILVVEDDEVAQMAARGVFEKQLCANFTLAKTGKEAIQQVTANKYDIIFMDLGLPDIIGTDVSQELRALGCLASIIALTAHDDAEMRRICQRAGINDFLVKPINIGKARAVTAKWLLHNAEIIVPQNDSIALDATKILDFAACQKLVIDEDYVNKVWKILAGLLPGYLHDLQRCYENFDTVGLHKLSHKLVGAAASAGAPRLQMAAIAMRDATYDTGIEMAVVTDLYNGLIAAIKELMQEYAKLGITE